MSHPFDFAHIVVFVDTQGLYRHMASVANAFPNIAEPTGSNGVLTKCADPFAGDSVWERNELPTAAQLPEPLRDERIKWSVHQDLYRVSRVYVLSSRYQTLSKTSNSTLTPSDRGSKFKPSCSWTGRSLSADVKHLARYFGQSSARS